ncbi:DUF4105 domain-containing protein [Flavobacteriaceae bacterium 3-367]
MKHLRKILFLLALANALAGFSQPQLSDKAQISVLSCGAGSDLYTTFGHSAFRVQDADLGIDVVYNYGTFNFDPPGFYVDFARGKLIYRLSRQRLDNFLFDYEMENRWVKEQLLDLTTTEKNALFQFLENNYSPENREYQYDFFYDNCASKIRDVLQEVLGNRLVFDESYLENPYTFRELIHQNLSTNSWSAFGIDLALGCVIDKKASASEHLFLPNYVLLQLGHASLDQRPLVLRQRTVLDKAPLKNGDYFLSGPLFWFILLLLFVIVISYIDYRNNVRSRWLDFFLFFLTGIIGILICFLWFLTDHTATVGNFNILWAFPGNLVLAFYFAKHKPFPSWIPKYFLVLPALLVLTLFIWVIKFQVFSVLIIPLLLTLGLRYLLLAHQFHVSKKK